jgi:hypothetical protein
MKTLKVTWKGLSPLIMHSCQCVNPMLDISKDLKKLTSKKTKTEDDLTNISHLEWEAGLYWDKEIGPYIPAENIEATIRNGAKANKKGKDIEKYLTVSTLYAPLDYGEKLTKEQLRAKSQYRDVRPMTVNRAKILRTRPRFDTWKIEFEVIVHENKIDDQTIIDAMDYAGLYVGLCDSRPKYGKFTTIIEEV